MTISISPVAIVVSLPAASAEKICFTARLIGIIAAEYGVLSPVVAICPSLPCAGDQDWHRGDFAVVEAAPEWAKAEKADVPGEIRIYYCPRSQQPAEAIDASAYDLTELHAAACEWRHRAFCLGEPVEVGAHCADTANRLFDLLTPPPGCRVVVTRPWEMFELEASEPISADLEREIRAALGADRD